MNLFKKIILGIFVVFTFVVGLSFILFKHEESSPVTRIEIQEDTFQDMILELVNKQRVQAGLKPLVRNSLLDKSARLKAKDMLAKGYWSHYDPQGHEPWMFFEEVGYNYHFAGENLAKNFYSPDSVMYGWMNSPTHKDLILDPDFKDTGIAVDRGNMDGFDTVVVVEHFGAL